MLNQHGSLLFVFQIPSPLFLIVESSSPDAPRTWRNFSPKTFLNFYFNEERRRDPWPVYTVWVLCWRMETPAWLLEGTEAGAAGRTVRGLGRAWGAERRLGFSFPPLAEKCLGLSG
ncbi:hypothetical protein ES288_A09G070000v1 [Gossypium darwinii]|uniref:Uncharacterized protein n=1 Tax=Gossypium darwinii TaxID=34276 RepID=A0A5D2F656_GOSDA|nr:hypothetical protein ES288_A09G070000v1 [Gossypium darwinii]